MLFESICLALTGAFIAGKFEGRGVGQAPESEIINNVLKSERKTGPYPMKRERIIQRLLQELQNGVNLERMKQEDLTERYGDGAVRGTVVAARDEALSRFASMNADKASSDNDKD